MENEQEFIEAIQAGDDLRLTTLLQSANNLRDLLNATITNRSPTNHAIGYGMTLLQFASLRRRKSGNAAQTLQQHGADVDLHSACGLGLVDTISQILREEPQAKDWQIDSYYPMQLAITAGNAESVTCLCRHGDDPNRDLKKIAYFGWEDDIRNDDYTPWKPIHMASLWCFDASRTPVIDALASAGANLNCVAPLDGYHPLHLVSMADRVDAMQCLISHGADVDSPSQLTTEVLIGEENQGPIRGHGCTPLMVAAAEGFPQAVDCLLKHGADPTRVTNLHQKAIDFAQNRFWQGQPYDEVIDLLQTATE